ncbi:MAG TPA: hypothetical protein PK358_17445 [Spirochaetota bacterium]|nr:hypothetical protein [Spirochaetota bacterium]
MKRLLIISLFVPLLALATGCYFMDEAETLNPGDETYYNPAVPEGAITTLTATVGNISEANPYIIVEFSSPVNSASVVYDTSVQVQYPVGTPLSEGVDYDGITNTSTIILDLTSAVPTSGTTVRVILTSGINAYADNSVTLTPVNVTRTLP